MILSSRKPQNPISRNTPFQLFEKFQILINEHNISRNMIQPIIESLITAIPLLWDNILGVPTELIFIVFRLLWKATKWYVDYSKK